MILNELTSDDIEKYLKISKSILIPIGSMEQHSNALPLATDTLIAENIAREIAKRKKWLVGPAINIGYSDEPQPFMKFTGTISYCPETLILAIFDYISSLCKHDFRNFYIINAHGGNNKFVKTAAVKLKKKLPKCKIFLHNWWEISEVRNFSDTINKNAMGHAGTIEAALALYLFPNKVHRKFFNREYNYTNTKTGIIDSDQTLATKAIGREVFGLIVKNILKEINADKNKLK